MLLGGDELGRTQRGNNNAYPQDNEVSWYEWEDIDRPFLDFVRRLTAMRRDHPVLRQSRWLTGTAPLGSPIEDVAWLHPDGSPMTPERWHDAGAQALMIHLNGATAAGGEPAGTGPSVLLMLNGNEDPADFVVPGGLGDVAWVPVIDTAHSEAPPPDRRHAGDGVTVAALAMVVLTEVDGGGTE
jgi:glycogen operon protein